MEDINKIIIEMAPNVLVCDIEGAEEFVIPGCDLSSLRAVVLELHPSLVSRKGMQKIYDACINANLYPKIELSSKQVVAFERV